MSHIERHVLNGMVLTATQLSPDTALEDFLYDCQDKLTDPVLHNWLDGLDEGMWIIKRGKLLIEMQDDVYRALFRGQY